MDVNNFIIKYSASLIPTMIRNILDKQNKKKCTSDGSLKE